MAYRDVTRFAWALAASLLLHLVLVADISQFHWPQTTNPASSTPLLEVRFSPVSYVKPMSAPTRQRRSSALATSRSRTHQDVSIPEPLPVVDGVIAAYLPDTAQRPRMPEPLPDVGNVIPADPPDLGPGPTFAPRGVIQPAPLAKQQEGAIQSLPAGGKLLYQFYWGEAHWLAGYAVHEWAVKDGYYTLSSSVRTTGLFALLHPTQLVEVAKGLVIGDRLRPLQFSTQFNDHPPSLAFFNWEKGRFRWFRGNTPSTQPLPADSYDKISFLYQLYLAQEKDGWSSAYITTGRGLVRYDIENLGLVEIEIDGRTFPARHLRKIASPVDSAVIDVWLSTVHNLPVKITYSTQAGEHFEQVISPESIPVD